MNIIIKAILLLSFILAFPVNASIVDYGPPMDANGNWQFDLYNASGVERGLISTALFFRLTDGTNTMPTMDAVGRAGFFKLTDGTNTAPTMDSAARAGFQKVTDGTSTAAVKAASTSPSATDPALVVTLSPNSNGPTSSFKLQDGSGNPVTSQASGGQRALDVGINVGGTQIDPRTEQARTTAPTAYADATQQFMTLNEFGMMAVSAQAAMLAHWGKMFSATSNFVSTGTTAQTALFLFRNPNGSGVTCKLRKINFYGNGGTFRVYQDPTVTANGTAVTSSGNRQTGQATASCLATTLPTVSANGTVFKSFTEAAQTVTSETFDFARLEEANHSLLITIVQSANTAAGSVDIEWSEQ